MLSHGFVVCAHLLALRNESVTHCAKTLCLFVNVQCVNYMIVPADFDDMAQPHNWPVNVQELEEHRADSHGHAYENEDLIVWMRTAALPTFRKLYRKVKRTGDVFEEGLPKGTYKLSVGYGK